MNPLRRVAAAGTGLVIALTGALMAAPAAQARANWDLAGLWLFNEKSGQTAYDLSFSGNSGQLGSTAGVDANDPTRFSLPRWFLPRGGLSFDGGDFVKVVDAPSLEPDGVTVAARVRSTAPGTFTYLLAKGALECYTASYGLYTGADGGLRFYVSDGAEFTLSNDAGSGLWDGRWHTVVGAYDGTRVRLWVDGRQVGSPVPAGVTIRYGLPSDDNLYIGSYAGPCEGFSPGYVGDLDGVAVFGSSAGTAVGDLLD